MSDAKLMLPLFYNGMFNRDGRKIRAVHNYDVSNGEYAAEVLYVPAWKKTHAAG